MSEIHAQSVSYVRDTMLPEQAPPVTQTGAIKWVRENLLSSWLNAILTVLSIAFIYWVFAHTLPWFFNSVWNARSLNECREVFAAMLQDEQGACWAVLKERSIQLIFGFYPADLYWRPILAFLLLFVALAPILFSDKVPSQMLWFSGLYPFLMPWLLWGGAVWTPILVIAGLAVGYLVYLLGSKAASPLLGVVLAIPAALIWWLYVVPVANEMLYKIVGSAREEAVIANLDETAERLPERIEVLEAERDTLTEQLNAAEAVKQEALGRIEAISTEIATAAEEEARAELEPDFAVTSDMSEQEATRQAIALSEAVDRRVSDAVRDARDLPEVEEQRDIVLAQIAVLTDLGAQITDLSGRINLLGDELREAEQLRTNIENLDDSEARVVELEQQLAAKAEELPQRLVNLADAELAPEDTPEEQIETLEEYLDLKTQLLSAQNVVDVTYKSLGLIGLEPIQSREFGGFMLSFLIGISGIILSMPLGIVLALGRQSDLFFINKVSVGFIEIIRGVPLIVWLFTAQLLLNYFLPPETNFDLLLRVIIMVTLFASAYIAEVVRGGLAALPKGQYEAADALGLDYAKSMRLIVLPQALKISIPGIVNTFIGLFKDTTLVLFIGLFDPLGLLQPIRSSTEWNGIYWELFVFVGLMFFVCCYSMGRYSLFLEKKLQREHR